MGTQPCATEASRLPALDILAPDFVILLVLRLLCAVGVSDRYRTPAQKRGERSFSLKRQRRRRPHLKPERLDESNGLADGGQSHCEAKPDQ